MNLGGITIAILALDTLAWAGVALAMFGSGSDPATAGLDRAAGIAVTALFVLTSVPAFVLTRLRRAPRAALALALAFPSFLGFLFVAAIVGFHR